MPSTAIEIQDVKIGFYNIARFPKYKVPQSVPIQRYNPYTLTKIKESSQPDPNTNENPIWFCFGA